MNNPILDQEYTTRNFSNKKLPSKEYDTCVFRNCDFTEADISVVTYCMCIC